MIKYENLKNPQLIDKLRYCAYIETKELLHLYKKACIIRPTGFGKTGILTRFIQDIVEQSKTDDIKIVYLYPNDVVKNTVLSFYYGPNNIPKSKQIPNVEFVTYTALARTKKGNFKKYKNLKLIIADECHKLGAKLTSVAIKQFLHINANVSFLGATATPYRMDNIDVVSEYFDNNVISEYTLHDAFMDGILKHPYYCYAAYDIKDKINYLKNRVRYEIQPLNEKAKKVALKLMEENLEAINNEAKFENVIRNVCNKCVKDTSYMKGIVFCPSFKVLHDSIDEVKSWFQKAYPSHNIRTLIVTSETNEYRNNLNKLNRFSYTSNTIDLIFSCDMLNLGYHVDNLTFVAMHRLTRSLNIFIQQFGRVLNSGELRPSIVFDLVDNLHTSALYKVLDRKSELTILARKRFNELKRKIILNGKDINDISVLTEEEQKEYKALSLRFSSSSSNHWWENANKLTADDIIVTSHSAKYRELIAKTVAEPISMRCRQAYANWNEERKLYENDYKEQVTKEYILEEAFPPEHLPLEPFALNKRVSVEQILHVIFDTDENYHNLYEKYSTILQQTDFRKNS